LLRLKRGGRRHQSAAGARGNGCRKPACSVTRLHQRFSSDAVPVPEVFLRRSLPKVCSRLDEVKAERFTSAARRVQLIRPSKRRSSAGGSRAGCCGCPDSGGVGLPARRELRSRSDRFRCDGAGAVAGARRRRGWVSRRRGRIPEPAENPVTMPGDLWPLGNHRLLCGNATVLADVERGRLPARRHDLLEPAIQRRLRQHAEGQTPRQAAPDLGCDLAGASRLDR
jgi:hypothetical protein